mgnify:CR=1 FL=1
MTVPVLIMAGGRGLRLHPLTETRPKPMLPVGTKPILQTIIEGFVKQGFRDIWLSVNYKAELIKAHFGDGKLFNCNITYLHETEPLGTGGALRLLKARAPVIVSNADVLVTMDYVDLVTQHRARCGNLATICTALYQHQVAYGVIDSDSEGRLTELREKPIESFQINAGIYVIDPRILEYAPVGRFDITEVLSAVPAGRVTVYPLADFWVDIGRFEDLTRAHIAALATE